MSSGEDLPKWRQAHTLWLRDIEALDRRMWELRTAALENTPLSPRLMMESEHVKEMLDALISRRPEVPETESAAVDVEVDGSAADPLPLVQAPALPEFVVALLSDPKKADAILGDLNERLHSEATDPLVGPRRARMRYWARTLRSIGPLLWRAIKKAGIFGAVVAAIRHWASARPVRRRRCAVLFATNWRASSGIAASHPPVAACVSARKARALGSDGN